MITKIKIINSNLNKEEDIIAIEEEYELFINNKFIGTFSISPSHIKEFAIGHAISEGYVNEIDKVLVDNEKILVFGSKKIRDLCIKKPNIDVIKRVINYNLELKYWKLTGCFHWASIFNNNGKFITLIEDISRSCAVDKVIGYAYLNNYNNIILKFSGRIFKSIVKKAANSGIKVIISKSPATDKAIKLAKERDITLIGFAREGRFNIYNL
ncbi:formate dehydrogenase family accessory protein FdhD [Methanocaldococcus villosus KIN24-T80]|uniref:Formate dehydrogenase family accessory protein FdhD n=1 Tax=Methanocaldococcus villosus KIN24-T80 TaxID=1069083 RepID=N6VRA1_9EURY|nr:formate dehydrogenase accessory sulfurtransferase FdhD [Methanocaldococcus villosus]ENN96430.1 formate dehydrogenase family accessory protein FdhD [Methanocaldococcus villosus KIN24-T80]